MRNLVVAGTLGLFFALGASSDMANAGNPNVPSWSPYAIMGAAPQAAPTHAPVIERRAAAMLNNAAATLNNPEGALNDYYKDVGLSDDPDDCNRGCAVHNGL